ncbi:MAG: hypothetical protein ACLFWG_00105 [Longimicrobiales bacterium]
MTEAALRHAGFCVWALPDREEFEPLPRAVIRNTETGAVAAYRLLRVDVYDVVGLPPDRWWGS